MSSWKEEIPVVTISQEQIDLKLQCGICLEEFNVSEQVHQLTCQHIYHKPCILQWLERNYTCPTCRTALHNNSDSDSSLYNLNNQSETGENTDEDVSIDVLDFVLDSDYDINSLTDMGNLSDIDSYLDEHHNSSDDIQSDEEDDVSYEFPSEEDDPDLDLERILSSSDEEMFSDGDHLDEDVHSDEIESLNENRLSEEENHIIVYYNFEDNNDLDSQPEEAEIDDGVDVESISSGKGQSDHCSLEDEDNQDEEKSSEHSVFQNQLDVESQENDQSHIGSQSVIYSENSEGNTIDNEKFSNVNNTVDVDLHLNFEERDPNEVNEPSEPISTYGESNKNEEENLDFTVLYDKGINQCNNLLLFAEEGSTTNYGVSKKSKNDFEGLIKRTSLASSHNYVYLDDGEHSSDNINLGVDDDHLDHISSTYLNEETNHNICEDDIKPSCSKSFGSQNNENGDSNDKLTTKYHYEQTESYINLEFGKHVNRSFIKNEAEIKSRNIPSIKRKSLEQIEKKNITNKFDKDEKIYNGKDFDVDLDCLEEEEGGINSIKKHQQLCQNPMNVKMPRRKKVNHKKKIVYENLTNPTDTNMQCKNTLCFNELVNPEQKSLFHAINNSTKDLPCWNLHKNYKFNEDDCSSECVFDIENPGNKEKQLSITNCKQPNFNVQSCCGKVHMSKDHSIKEESYNNYECVLKQNEASEKESFENNISKEDSCSVIKLIDDNRTNNKKKKVLAKEANTERNSMIEKNLKSNSNNTFPKFENDMHIWKVSLMGKTAVNKEMTSIPDNSMVLIKKLTLMQKSALTRKLFFSKKRFLTRFPAVLRQTSLSNQMWRGKPIRKFSYLKKNTMLLKKAAIIKKAVLIKKKNMIKQSRLSKKTQTAKFNQQTILS